MRNSHLTIERIQQIYKKYIERSQETVSQIFTKDILINTLLTTMAGSLFKYIIKSNKCNETPMYYNV